MKKLCVAVILSFIAGSIGGVASAQDTTGTIAGRIVDTQGLVLPGATITATGSQGSKSSVTGADGRFTVPFLTPGSYRVHAELQGFTPVDRPDVQVRLGQTVEIPLTLQIGAVQESIQVASSSTTVAETPRRIAFERSLASILASGCCSIR